MADTSSPSDAAAIGRVGFIGLGDMGGAMATRIIAAGYPTVLWARRPEVLTPYEAANATTAGSPKELAAAVDLIGICVWAEADVRDVLEGDDGVLAGCRPGTVIAIHSTIAPSSCRDLARDAAARDVVVLDAPVSGGRDVALEGALVVSVGGDRASVDRCRPVFETFGDLIVHLGAVGSGQIAKLVNNALLAANLAVADDALSLGAALGLAPDALATVLRGSSGRSFGLDVLAVSRRSGDARHQVLQALEKDVEALVADAAPEESQGVRLLADAAAEAVRRLADPPDGWS